MSHLRSVLTRYPYVRHLGWVALAVLVSFVVANQLNREDPWVEVGTLEELRASDVVYVEAHGVFVVHRGRNPIALSEEAPSPGGRVLWCPTAEVFEETRHGSKFDRTGAYLDGPAPRGLGGVAVRVEGEVVLIDPQARLPGPERGDRVPLEPGGAFCADPKGNHEESPPGFARPAASG